MYIIRHIGDSSGIPSYLHNDNNTKFVSKCFGRLCTQSGIKHLKMNAHRLQTSGQVECYNMTILTRLNHYVATKRPNWDLFVQPLTYAYSTQVQRSTNTVNFSLVLTRNSPSLMKFDKLPALAANSCHGIDPQNLQTQLLAHINKLQKRVNNCLNFAQTRYKTVYETMFHSMPRFKPGLIIYIVMLSIAASFTGNVNRLAATSYNNLMPKAMRCFPSLVYIKIP